MVILLVRCLREMIGFGFVHITIREALVCFDSYYWSLRCFSSPHNSLFLSFAASLDAISVNVCCHGNAADVIGNL